MENNIAYKILTKDLKSYLVTGSSKEYSIQYSRYNITKTLPNTLGLFCFKNYKKAVNYYINTDIKGRMFEVIGYNPIDVHKVAGVLSSLYLDNFYKRFRYDKLGIMISNNYIFPPNNTICFESIKLIKEIYLYR